MDESKLQAHISTHEVESGGSSVPGIHKGESKRSKRPAHERAGQTSQLAARV